MEGEEASAEVESPYLAGLPPEQRALLAQVNRSGLASLQEHLATRTAIAFLGSGASAPLYPMWNELVEELVAHTADRLTPEAVATFRARAGTAPDAIVELLRRELGPAQYRELLRATFRQRRDPRTGRSWTAVQELVVRCPFAGVITTNYDPGIVNVRMAVRPNACGTAFASWTNGDVLNRWRSDEVFGDEELPVLYAHGHHYEPDGVVLARSEYRRAYSGMLGRVLASVFRRKHVMWIGFSFADERIRAILRVVEENTSGRENASGGEDAGTAPRHVAIMPWDPSDRTADGLRRTPDDPRALRALIEVDFNARLVLYPAAAGDHSALERLLEEHVDGAFTAPAPPHPATTPTFVARGVDAEPVVNWVHGGVPVPNFTGRVEDLARLQRWASDRTVRLIGVNAWGGSGKTALITEWLTRDGTRARSAVRGVFAWSFYEARSVELWAEQLLAWVEETFELAIDAGPLPRRLLQALRAVPVLLVLDGLEVMQEGPAGAQYGRVLDGLLRRVLVALCQSDEARGEAEPGRVGDRRLARERIRFDGLVVLTSRFPFADLEPFAGGAVRIAEVDAFTPTEGSELLERAGGDWLSESDRRSLVSAVDGHALGLSVLASMLASGLDHGEVARLRVQLQRAGRTDARVARVLRFYSEQLSDADRHLVAFVSLFQRPVAPKTLLTLGTDEELGAPLRGWRHEQIEEAVRQRLTGLLTWHPEGDVSAHPLVRDSFRALVLSGDAAHRISVLMLADLPLGPITSREDGLRVVELVELLLDAEDWRGADALYAARTGEGAVWRNLPAAMLGHRCAMAFVGTQERRDACREQLGPVDEGFYLTQAGLAAMHAADVGVAEGLLRDAVDHERTFATERRIRGRRQRLSAALRTFAQSRLELGDAEGARAAAEEARVIGAATGDRVVSKSVHALAAAAAHLSGDTSRAEWEFVEADVIERLDGNREEHLHGWGGCVWAEFLLQTGRVGAARQLTARNRAVAARRRWSTEVAHCDRILAQCDLADGRPAAARPRLERALTAYLDGDLLLGWGATLPVLAEHLRCMKCLSEAESVCAEAITLAGPRLLTPTHAAALVARARVYADRWRCGGPKRDLERARDDAELALHLSTRVHRLPWHELAALELHAGLDAHTATDHGWAAGAERLRQTLRPRLLAKNPLSLADALLAQREAAD